MNEKEIINTFLHYGVSRTIIQRGEKLYREGAVRFERYDEETDTYFFKVKGTQLYDVKIYNLHSGEIDTSCTCPYDWGPVCKHTVAALVYMKKVLVSQLDDVSDNTPAYRKKNDPVLIQNFRNLNFSDLKDYFPHKKASENQLTFDSDYVIIDHTVLQDRVIFMVRNYKGPKYTITCQIDGNDLIINTDYQGRVRLNKLKETEIFILSIIYKYFDDFLALLDPEKLEYKKKEICDKYGLDLHDFDKFFELKFDYTGLKLVKRPEAEGLLSLTEKNELEEIVNKLSSSSNGVENLVPPKRQNELYVGFALYPNINELRYTPIFGKVNKAKTKFVLSIEQVKQTTNLLKLNISNKQRDIIDLVNLYYENFESLAPFEHLFSISTSIFKELTKQPLVYFYEGNVRYSSKLTKSKLYPAKLSQTPASALLKVEQDNKFVYLKVYFRIEDKLVPIDEIDMERSGKNIIFYNNVFYHLSSPRDAYLVGNMRTSYKVAREYKHVLYEKALQHLARDYEIIIDDSVFQVETVNMDYKKKQIFLSERDEYIIFKLQVAYDNDIEMPLLTTGDYLVYDSQKDIITRFVRNKDLENDFLDEISNLHPEFEEQKPQKFFYLHYQDFIKDLWFYKFFEYTRNHQIELYGTKDLKKFNYSPHQARIITSIKSDIDWFDLEVNISFGENIVSLKDIRNAIINKNRYIQLDDGSVGILPEQWLHKLEKYFRNATKVEDNELKISKLRFTIIDELFEQVDQTEIFKEIQEKKKRLKELTQIENIELPQGIKAKLRDYQKAGYNWLYFLHKMGWGGILADDMGLGKTLQILTFLKKVIEKDKTPNLIIVPTTLLFNWQNEIEKFVPSLKAFYLYGKERQRCFEEFDKYNIIFTTYGTLLRDIQWLKDYQFNYVILDESQAIKNPASRRFKAVSLLKAKNRIALTGTPIENSTFDLYAQMSFVNPGFFGSIDHFRQNYANPIDRDGNEVIAKELQKIINPFILRRTKEQVAPELPPKTEEVIYCEMPPAQRKVYDAYKNHYRETLLDKIEQEGLNKTRFMVLEALTRLRQICDSPLLLNDENINVKDSAKIDEILTHITEKTANHKLLIFSQFTSMLALLRQELDRLNIPYEYLDGKSSTTQREFSVKRFQNDPDLRVFLISLKAGGTGLNLTAADYVYILDPWWNPAVENQAIDRIYRIGQDKKVFAYRMVCKNTVEEKILDLQAKKKKIASDIIQTDENLIKKLDIEDIKNLLD